MVAMVALLICYYYATHILHTFVVGIKILALALPIDKLV